MAKSYFNQNSLKLQIDSINASLSYLDYDFISSFVVHQ